MYVVYYNLKYDMFEDVVNEMNGLYVLVFLFEVIYVCGLL